MVIRYVMDCVFNANISIIPNFINVKTINSLTELSTGFADFQLDTCCLCALVSLIFYSTYSVGTLTIKRMLFIFTGDNISLGYFRLPTFIFTEGSYGPVYFYPKGSISPGYHCPLVFYRGDINNPGYFLPGVLGRFYRRGGKIIGRVKIAPLHRHAKCVDCTRCGLASISFPVERYSFHFSLKIVHGVWCVQNTFAPITGIHESALCSAANSFRHRW